MNANRGTFRTFAVTLAMTALTLVAGAQTSIFQVVPTPNQNEINNVLNASSASSPNDVWAVGNTTIHFDGKRWKAFRAPGGTADSPLSLRGVLTFSPTLAWAGGGGDDDGQIIDQWNGKKWERLQGLPFPPAWNPLVMTMSGTSSSDVWVAGAINSNQTFQLFFEHWNGAAWEANNYLPGAVAWLLGASQDATNDAWAVGLQLIEDAYNYPLIVNYNGSRWIVADLPFPQGAENSQLEGVLALARDNVWAVGWQSPGVPNYYTSLTLIYHFDGKSWTVVPSPGAPGTSLDGIVANSANDLYAFGMSADPSGYGFDSLVLHGDGNEWTIIPSPNPRNNPYDFVNNELLTGVVPSPGNVWIFGEQFGSPQGICTINCSLALHATSGD
jgi:hypothetical protein